MRDGLKEKGARNCPIIAVHVTDKDVAYYAAKLLMAPNVHSYKHDKHKRIYGFAICSTEAASWMMTLYPLMGKRRKAKIKQILNHWKKPRKHKPHKKRNWNRERRSKISKQLWKSPNYRKKVMEARKIKNVSH